MLRSRFRPVAVLLPLVLLTAGCGGDGGGGGGGQTEIKVFAAASLTAAFNKLGEGYAAANSGTRVTFHFAGSQALATQIQQGAPADVFASADVTNMDKVKDLVSLPQVSASNRLQIIVAAGNPKGVKRLADLARGEADAAIVSVTAVAAGGDEVEGVDIPADQNVPATYPIATVKASTHQRQAQAFVDLVRSAQGQGVLQSFGFLPPPIS